MGLSSSSSVQNLIDEQIKTHPVLMYCTTQCGYCVKAKNAFDLLKVNPYIVYLDKETDGEEIANVLYSLTKQDTVPNIFVARKHIGGYMQLVLWIKKGLLQQELRNLNIKFEEFSF